MVVQELFQRGGIACAYRVRERLEGLIIIPCCGHGVLLPGSLARVPHSGTTRGGEVARCQVAPSVVRTWACSTFRLMPDLSTMSLTGA
jgi:hypothetical protein